MDIMKHTWQPREDDSYRIRFGRYLEDFRTSLQSEPLHCTTLPDSNLWLLPLGENCATPLSLYTIIFKLNRETKRKTNKIKGGGGEEGGEKREETEGRWSG